MNPLTHKAGVGHLPILTLLAALAGGTLALAAEDASALSGRWHAGNGPGPETLHAIGIIDFAPCGAGLGGSQVGADGTCGTSILRGSAEAKEIRRFSGQLVWLNRTFDLHAELAPEGLRLNAVTPGAPLMARSTIPLIGLFVRDGPA